MAELLPEPLTAEAFAPFGEIVAAGTPAPGAGGVVSINDGTARRYDDLAEIDTGDGGGRTVVSIFVAEPRATPVAVELVERHPLGSQLFVPLSEHPYLVVVAAGDPPFEPASFRAFLVEDGSGVNYRKGVWHMPLCALAGRSRFLVVDRAGPGGNCEEHRIPAGARPAVLLDRR